jgi:flagellar biosynthesis regulator FlaF
MTIAAQAYAHTALSGLSGKPLEAAVLRRCAARLQHAASLLPADPDPLIAAIDANRRVWSILLDCVEDEESPLARETRILLHRTGLDVLSRQFEIASSIADGRPVDAAAVTELVAVNKALATGLAPS